jgi:Flp pilus assembly protein TadB
MKINYLNFYLLIPLFAISYILFANISAKVYKESLFRDNYNYKKTKTKPCYNFAKRKDVYLKGEGYPLKLNGLSYYVSKTMLTIFFVIYGYFLSGMSPLLLGFAAAGFYIIDIILILYKKDREQRLLTDLVSIIDATSLQLSAGVPLNRAIKGIWKYAQKCKDLKEELAKLATRYELSQMDINYATEQFSQHFNLLEVKMFALALRQYDTTNKIEEMLDGLRRVIEQKYMHRLEISTKSKKVLMICGVVLIMVNTVALIFYPVFTDINQKINRVFQ